MRILEINSIILILVCSIVNLDSLYAQQNCDTIHLQAIGLDYMGEAFHISQWQTLESKANLVLENSGVDDLYFKFHVHVEQITAGDSLEDYYANVVEYNLTDVLTGLLKRENINPKVMEYDSIRAADGSISRLFLGRKHQFNGGPTARPGSLQLGSNNPVNQWAAALYVNSSANGKIDEYEMKRTLHEIFHTVLSINSHFNANEYYDTTGIATIMNFDRLTEIISIAEIQLMLSPQNVEDLYIVVEDLQNNDTAYLYDCTFGSIWHSELTQNPSYFYPNPTYGDLNSSLFTMDLIELYSSNGVLLETWFKSGKIDLSNRPSGIYFLKLRLENGEIAMQKIVKM